MKIFELYDEEISLSIGTLLYYEKEGTFIIELQDHLDEWTAPLLFASYVKKHVYTIPRDISRLWVEERIIPSGRQNIDDILRHHKLKRYDEMKFLETSEGRCSQDHIYIRKIDCLPDYVQERMKHNLTDIVVSSEWSLICFFKDDTVRKVKLAELGTLTEAKKVLKNKALFESAKIATGGYSVTFNDSIDIPAHILYMSGTGIPLMKADFIAFVQKNVIDTGESCRTLECTRQNLHYMFTREQIRPIKVNVKGSLYMKGEILRHLWD